MTLRAVSAGGLRGPVAALITRVHEWGFDSTEDPRFAASIDRECEELLRGFPVAPDPARRALVQGDSFHPAGTVPWCVHETAWLTYAAAGHGSQSAERINERHGFGYRELQCLLAGHYKFEGCREKHPAVPGWAPR